MTQRGPAHADFNQLRMRVFFLSFFLSNSRSINVGRGKKSQCSFFWDCVTARARKE